MLLPSHSRKSRRGSVLVEFALISLVLYLLLAATIEMGRMMFTAQATQTAADIGARELAKTPLPPGTTFDQFLFPQSGEDPSLAEARARVYDRKYLVIPLDDNITPPLPLLNQQLKLLMIVDELPDGTRVRRYPGALEPLTDNAFGYTVRIPILKPDESGYDMVEVVEEIQPTGASEGPFSLVAPAPNPTDLRGMVALRINYPYQAATMTAFRPNPADVPGEPPNPNLDYPVLADDGDSAVGTYAGPLGLGRQFALGKEVRPFRKVISAQAVSRREVFN